MNIRKILLFLAIGFACSSSFAQEGSVFNRIPARQSKDRSQAIMIGVKGGLNLSSMDMYYYGDKVDISDTLKWKAGVFVEIPINKYFSVAPELNLIRKGIPVVPSLDGSPYRINVSYFDFRFPFIFGFPIKKFLYPYVFAAPSFAVTLPSEDGIFDDDGIFHETDTAYISQSNFKDYDFGAVVGAGIRLNLNFDTFTIVMKFDVAYHQCFVKNEHDNNHLQPPFSYVDENYRNKGLELTLSLGLPLKFDKKSGGCSDFGNKHDRRY